MHELMEKIGINKSAWSDLFNHKTTVEPGTSNSLYDAMDKGNMLLKYDQIV